MLQDSTDYTPFGCFSKIFRFSTGYMLKLKLMTELPLTWLRQGCQTSLSCSVDLPILYWNGKKPQQFDHEKYPDIKDWKQTEAHRTALRILHPAFTYSLTLQVDRSATPCGEVKHLSCIQPFRFALRIACLHLYQAVVIFILEESFHNLSHLGENNFIKERTTL